MFTGIIIDIGEVAEWKSKGDDVRLRIRTGNLPLPRLTVGDSIAVNGVCLTATALPGDGFYADVSAETLRCTTLQSLKMGSRVNLETAMTPESALGGHWVSGHVDGVGRVLNREPEGRSIRYTITLPSELARYVAPKGSIAVDGVSLTVNQVNHGSFTVNIVPHTLEKTIFSGYRPETPVNLEVDIIARYLERLMSFRYS
ncbi:MAG TPA: riboflavin synthase [Gammaproteobacteria bacterium]|jgi:riboflavin synthase